MTGFFEEIVLDADRVLFTGLFAAVFFRSVFAMVLFFADFGRAGALAAAFFFAVFFAADFFLAGFRAVALVPERFFIAIRLTSVDHLQTFKNARHL